MAGVHKLEENDVSIIICPPATHLLFFREYLDENNLSFISLGAQDIAIHEPGAYTGEITGAVVQEVADYVLLGHSECRKYQNETPDVIQQKIHVAEKYGLLPIVLMEKYEKYFGGIFAIGYEPKGAIGSGYPQPVSEANTAMKDIVKNYPDAMTIYGGSVDEENIKAYLAHFNGVLVGTACVDPHEFLSVAKASL